jgi:hypothetical protein
VRPRTYDSWLAPSRGAQMVGPRAACRARQRRRSVELGRELAGQGDTAARFVSHCSRRVPLKPKLWNSLRAAASC